MEHYVNKNLSYLTFMIDQEIFSIEVTKVIEVLRNQEIFTVPKTENYIEGIINFRGNVLTVVNTRKKINVNNKSNNNNYVIIVLDLIFDDKSVKVGALADKVLNVIEIAENEIKPVPEFGNYYNPKYLKGAIKQDSELIIILDIEKIFSSKDVEILTKVTENKK